MSRSSDGSRRVDVARRVLACVAVASVGFAIAPRAAWSADAAPWVRPVDGAVVRAFEEPAGPYGPGHRGVDFTAAPGAPVRAAGDGTISFAGQVAGSLHVVIAHEGGLRTSYSFLELVGVRNGEAVRAGDVVGLAGGSGPEHEPGVLHFGLRLGDQYLDPMALFRPADLTRIVRLVPADEREAAPWTSPAEEAARLSRDLGGGDASPAVPSWVPTSPGDEHDGCGGGVPLIGGAVSAVCSAAGAVVGGVSAALDAGLSVLGRAGRVGLALVQQLRGPLTALWTSAKTLAGLAQDAFLATPLGHVLHDVVEIGSRFLAIVTRACADAPPADGTGGSGHMLLAVGGVDSAMGAPGDRSFDLDAAALGYRKDEVRWFSYSGSATYNKKDTYGDVDAKARLLAAQLQQMERENPGREVDLIAHSQGGVVVDFFLAHVYHPSDTSYPPLGTVVTLASPHQGDPLARVANELRATRTGRAVADAADKVAPGPPSNATSITQIAEGSPMIADIWKRGLPYNVQLTSIGGTDDPFVPATQIAVPGGNDIVVNVDGLNDHGNIPHDPRALQVVRTALERRPPPCATISEAFRGSLEPVIFTRVADDLATTTHALSALVP